jgi:hypothetical protein
VCLYDQSLSYENVQIEDQKLRFELRNPAAALDTFAHRILAFGGECGDLSSLGAYQKQSH